MKKILLIISFITIIVSGAFAYTAETRYRWRTDNGTETTAGTLDGNKPITTLNPVRLRASLDNTSPSAHFDPEYFSYTLTCNGVAITTDTTTSAPFVLYPSKYVTDGQATTVQTEPYGAFTPGIFIGTYKTGGTYVKDQTSTELEWCIKPTRHINPLTVYTFRPSGLSEKFLNTTLRTSYDIVPPKNPKDTIKAINFRAADNGVLVNFVTELGKHSSIVVKISRDRDNNYKVVKTLTNINGNYHQVLLPPTVVDSYGDRYINFELYDELNVMNVSPPIKYNVQGFVALKDFSVKPTNNPANPKEAEVKIATSALYYPYIHFAASDDNNKADSSKYQLLKAVIPYPTDYFVHNKTTNFTFLVEVLDYGKPRHFVLEYPQFEKKKHSQVISVTIPAPAALNSVQSFSIYPNPANSGKISFNLKGYKGKTLTASLTNLQGKSLGQETFNVNANENYVLKASAPAGTYVLNVTGEGITKTGKVLVQ